MAVKMNVEQAGSSGPPLPPVGGGGGQRPKAVKGSGRAGGPK